MNICIICDKKFERTRTSSGEWQTHFEGRTNCNKCRSRNVSNKAIKEAVVMFRAGHTFRYIAKKFDRSPDTMARAMRKYGGLREHLPTDSEHSFTGTAHGPSGTIKDICVKCGAPVELCSKKCPSQKWINEIEKCKKRIISARLG